MSPNFRIHGKKITLFIWHKCTSKQTNISLSHAINAPVVVGHQEYPQVGGQVPISQTEKKISIFSRVDKLLDIHNRKNMPLLEPKPKDEPSIAQQLFDNQIPHGHQ